MIVIDPIQARELVTIIQWIHTQGWSPATSTNYSFRNSHNPCSIAISQSGIDKSIFNVEDLMLIDEKGKPFPSFQFKKSSAETALHTVLYQENAEINVVLHTHSIYGTILSQHFQNTGKLTLKNYEVLKGLNGITTHETSIELPIFENTQDIRALSEDFRKVYQKDPQMQGYLIAGHGLYTWGNDMVSAKRQLEVLEFLLTCEYKKLAITPKD